MEVAEKLYLMKLNYAFNCSNTQWVVDFLNKYRKPSLLFNKKQDIISETELLYERFNKFIEIAKSFDAEKELVECEKKGIKVICYLEDDYPEELKIISSPPLALYIMGDLKPMLSVSIVGTRRPTEYGVKMTEKISYDLAKVGIRVVSGLARGIDTIAHKMALKAKGKTVAVIGSGFNYIYPPENKDLVDKIVKDGGAVITEYPLSLRPYKQNFPRRNRIISALSFATLVIEGDYNSGALITARYALEQGKDVMAVCGRVDEPNSNGPNKLIKEGAYLVRNAKDVIELIPSHELFGIDIKKLADEKKEREISITEAGRRIYNLLKEKRELTPDEISDLCNIDMPELFNYLFELETEGIIELFAGKYRIKEDL